MAVKAFAAVPNGSVANRVAWERTAISVRSSRNLSAGRPRAGTNSNRGVVFGRILFWRRLISRRSHRHAAIERRTDSHDREGHSTPGPAAALHANGRHRRQSDENQAADKQAAATGLNGAVPGQACKDDARDTNDLQGQHAPEEEWVDEFQHS